MADITDEEMMQIGKIGAVLAPTAAMAGAATGVGGAPQEGPRTAVADADVIAAMGILNSGRAESDEDRAMSREVLRKATPAQSRMARKELDLQPKKSGGAVKKKKKVSSGYMGGGAVYRGRSYAYGGRVAKYKG